MELKSKARKLSSCISNILRNPHECINRLAMPLGDSQGQKFADHWQKSAVKTEVRPSDANPLRAYFESHSEGAGIWKWLHYFEIYHRHLSKFVGKPVTVAEVGVYSGGSLGMWHHYFGDQCHVHGIDIMPECTVYQSSKTTIHIGDQSDRSFWNRFRRQVPSVDIVIDDGGHRSDQQIVTLEETLSHLSDGGVFICEDICGINSKFAAYVRDMADRLNALTLPEGGVENSAAAPFQSFVATPFQSSIASVHFYPFMIVIEKGRSLEEGMQLVKHGTHWQPLQWEVWAKRAS